MVVSEKVFRYKTHGKTWLLASRVFSLRLCCQIEIRHLWLPRLSTTEEEISVPIIPFGSYEEKRVKISLLYRKCRSAVVRNGNHTTCVVVCRVWKPGSRFRELPGICAFFHFLVFRTKFPRIPGWYHYVTNLKILYEIFHFALRKQKFVYAAYSVEQRNNVEIRSCSTANRVMQ